MTLIKKSSNLFPTVPTFFDDFFVKDLLGWSSTANKPYASYLPPVNIREDEHGFHVEVAVPGFKKENFKIELENDVLSISTEVENKTGEVVENYTRREYTLSSFKRTFSLPENLVDAEKVEAKYTDGILAIMLPKKEEAKPKPVKTISIN
jgi:HSP20 family protein